MPDGPLVSIVIPTKNSSKTLSTCLQSIRNQTYKNIELVIIDGNSDDETISIAQQFGAIIIQSDHERAQAKNFAMTKCQGKYICFIDSDMELGSSVIEDCVKVASSHESFGGIIIPERSVGSSFWVKVRDFERQLYFNTEIESARFFDRHLALEAGGFDNHIIFYEESVLPQKLDLLGYNTKIRVNSIILHHEPDFDFFKWIKKKYYYSKTLRLYNLRYRHYSSKQISIIYRLRIMARNGRWNLVRNLPLTTGILILKSGELIASMLGRVH